MNEWNKNFQRQVWKHLSDKPIPEELAPLLDSISDSYDNYEKELNLLNRIMDLSSKELFDANMELRKRNEELDRFVYSTSHDLRAPLTSILGLLQLIEIADDEKDMDEYLSQIKISTVQLDNFIQDIVAYTHNKKIGVEYQEIDLEELANQCIEKLDFMSNAHLIKKKVAIQSTTPFKSDIQRLDNIFTNLISNSIKYYNPQNKSPYINISIEVDDDKASIEIEDNGIGIKKDYLQKVFNMFYRASASSKGSGIGLYIVKEITDKLGGTVAVESTIDVGSTFRLEIPNENRTD